MQLNHNNRNATITTIAAISLDARKAFDMLEWGFLQQTLRRFGCGEGFVKWINIIYSDPRAAVITNGIISSFFNLSRGMKQGDPLSLLLFTLSLEPLASAIKAESNIKWVLHGGEEHKMFLYADDILLLLNDSLLAVPNVLGKV